MGLQVGLIEMGLQVGLTEMGLVGRTNQGFNSITMINSKTVTTNKR